MAVVSDSVPGRPAGQGGHSELSRAERSQIVRQHVDDVGLRLRGGGGGGRGGRCGAQARGAQGHLAAQRRPRQSTSDSHSLSRSLFLQLTVLMVQQKLLWGYLVWG